MKVSTEEVRYVLNHSICYRIKIKHVNKSTDNVYISPACTFNPNQATTKHPNRVALHFTAEF